MTWEEFYNGYLVAEMENTDVLLDDGVEDEDTFKEVDWTSHISHVKNQGMCGSCWSFSTTGSLEAAYSIFKGKTVELSE